MKAMLRKRHINSDSMLKAGVRYRSIYSCFLALAVVLALPFLVTGCKIVTIRPLDPVTRKPVIEQMQEGFDPVTYVDRIWENRVLPTVRNSAVPYWTLMDALRQDRDAASRRYGHQEGTRPYSFLVTGRGRVLEVDTSSLTGLLRVDVEPCDGKADVVLQIGPVIRGTALRDSLPFIGVNQFTNQLEYADVSRELHNRVKSQVLADLDKDTLPGATISFSGAFTLDVEDEVMITPVFLEVNR